MSLFQELHQLRIQATLVTYSAALKASVAVSHWRYALSLFGQLAAWTTGNLITSELAVAACERGMRSGSALKLLADVPKRGLTMLQKSRKFQGCLSRSIENEEL